ncbi:16S rRNA (cytidine(1402)-2'-O)-methyltransferase [Candidatus Parcubacteria bacterium]|nr:16S rRNA (cytidine(1402)-2'-O)-methyltransferase [Candidatus Parcubacteria bacterium]
MSTLYVIATPIGNLEDISLRALRILREVDFIISEKPATTQKLLSKYQIQKPILRYHQHSKEDKEAHIINLLRSGQTGALVSEAGTPGISDPGGKLIQKILTNFPEIRVVPIPGPSALTCAVSVSGFFMDKFLFLGFCPKKKKRKKFFEEISNFKFSVIFYESPYRILKTLKEMAKIESLKEREIVVCRELTKKFETIYRGKIEKVIKDVEKDMPKGEFVIIVGPKIDFKSQKD